MLKLGDKNITKLYYGDKAISKAYYGDKLVYKKAGGRFVTNIYFDGNCYIDTKVQLQSCIIETAVQYEAGHSRRMLNGWVGNNALYWGMTTSGTFELGGAGLGSNTNLTDYTEFEIVYDITAQTATPTVDGVTKSYSITPYSASQTYTIGCSIPSSSNKVIGDVYYHKFTDLEGVVIQDLRPYVDENGTACFKDIVTGNLFYNQGTGTLEYTE